jgi:hypothetical protein
MVWAALKFSDFSGPPLRHQIRANASDGGQEEGRNPLLPLRLRGVQHGGGVREGQEQAGHQPLPGRVRKNLGLKKNSPLGFFVFLYISPEESF